MKIFLAGSTGFIGRHFLNQIKNTSYEVYLLNRQREIFNDFQNIYYLDKFCLSSVEPSDLKGIDCVVNFASVGVSPKIASINDFMGFNICATVNLFESAAKAGVKRFITAGTCLDYGL